jgi:glycosyltransferase involved in cell wall biosynthesis
VRFAGLYDLRLKVSIDSPITHLREALYSFRERRVGPAAGEQLFAYLDARNRTAQKEMEQVFTDYLKKIGAYVPTSSLKRFDAGRMPFPVEASVVIPVRNRKETITEAVATSLSQKTDFPFNVIVVDNYSTDGTTSVLRDLAARNPTLHHVVPAKTGLAIGGCWNEALRSTYCGRYAVQLDSDDLYRTPHVLKRIIDMLRDGSYATVIGAYTVVDFTLEEIPPGLIDHREWTDENGHNNALRVNGLGAPRAFATALMRESRFPDVSYGEDYAACLRMCREWKVGRIYESLYLCRRWRGNTDSGLELDAANRNNMFKDEVRTAEILARQKMNRANS